MDRLRVRSTSRSSASARTSSSARPAPQGWSFVRSWSTTLRIRTRGSRTFLLQRKGQRDEWTDTEAIPLSQLEKDEGYRLEIKSSELLALFSNLKGVGAAAPVELAASTLPG